MKADGPGARRSRPATGPKKSPSATPDKRVSAALRKRASTESESGFSTTSTQSPAAAPPATAAAERKTRLVADAKKRPATQRNKSQASLPQHASEEIASLIENLHDAEQRLESLTAGEVDAVAGRDGRMFLLRRAQDRARQHEAAKQTAILNALPARIALLDTLGFIVSANEAWQQYCDSGTAQEPGHAVGANYLGLCDAAAGDAAGEAHQVAAGIRSVLAGEQSSFSIEYRCDLATRPRCFLLTVTTLAGGPRSGVVLTHFDVSGQKLAEMTLRESEERFRATFEQAAVGMAHIASDGRYLRVNDKYCEITGYERQELLQMWSSAVNAPDDQAAASEARRALLGGQRNSFSTERRLVRKDGAVFWVRVVSTPMRDAAGVPKYLSTVVEDVTLRKLADFRLERLNRLYAVLSRVAEAIARTRDAQQLYDEVCRIIVDDGLLPLALIAHQAPDSARIELTAHRGDADDYLEKFPLVLDGGPGSRGTIGIAMQTGRHEICNDFANDPRMAPWRERGRRHYFRSAASFPLKMGQSVVGVLVLYASEPNYFQEDEVRLMDAVSEDLSFAIESLQSEQRKTVAEERLRRSQTMLSSAVRLAELGSWEYDIVHDRLEWSEQTLRIFGCEPDGFGGDMAAFVRLVHPEDRGRLIMASGRATMARSVTEQEYRIVRPDGEERTVYDRGVVSFDDAGAPVRALGMVMDITERKRAEEAVRRSDERFRRVFNQQFQLMLILSTSGCVLEVNELPLRMGEVVRDEVVGLMIWNTVWMNGIPAAELWWTTTLTLAAGREEPLLREFQFKTASGETRQVDLAITAVNDVHGRAEYFIVQGADTTDRKRAEELARARAALLSIAGHTARLGGWSVDLPEGRITWSDEVCAIHEVPPGTIPSLEEAIEFYAPEWRDTMLRTVRACMVDGAPFDLELEIISATGRRVWVRTVGIPNRDASGEVVRLHGSFQDISERKRAESDAQARLEAEQANRSKSMFLSNMSHEIRTPMNGVIGMVDVLYQTNLDANQADIVDLIRDSAFSLLRIIEDVLDLSKIEAGKLEIERAPMAIAEVVEKVCSMAHPMADKQAVELAIFIDPRIPATVLGDAVRLRQILVNLVNNAVKFSSGRPGKKGRVSVRAVLAASDDACANVEFSVADNGIGMDGETVSRLFTSFTQADASTTRRFGGTGLGLAISRHLVSLMGGEVTVESEEDVGTTLKVVIPFVALVPNRKHAAAASPVHGLHCMVVGNPDADECPSLDELASYLLHAGALVERAPSLAEAARLARASATGVWVFLHATPDVALVVEDKGAAAATVAHLDMRHVIIGRGSRRQPRAGTERVVHVDREGLVQQTLVTAVAIAAGRAGSESEPRSRADRRQPAPAKTLARPYGITVLVAEDNETNQKVILRQLHLLGYAAHVAATGLEALKLWRVRRYALLLTDLRMPDLDGYDLTRRIRAEEAGLARIPIIALTANALKDEEQRCLAAGMDDYLTKPARLVSLQRIIERWLAPADALRLSDGSAEPRAAAASATAWRSLADPREAIDVRVLADLVGDDPAVIASFLEKFRASSLDAAFELRTAHAAALPLDVEAVAHRLKSSARSVGALALGDLCAEIEEAGAGRDLVAIGRLCTRFEEEMVAVCESLDSRCLPD